MEFSYLLPPLALFEIYIYSQIDSRRLTLPDNLDTKDLEKQSKQLQIQIHADEKRLKETTTDYKYIHDFFQRLPLWNIFLPDAYNSNQISSIAFTLFFILLTIFVYRKSSKLGEYRGYLKIGTSFISTIFIYGLIRYRINAGQMFLSVDEFIYVVLATLLFCSLVSLLSPDYTKFSIYATTFVLLLFMVYDRWNDYYLLKYFNIGGSFNELEGTITNNLANRIRQSSESLHQEYKKHQFLDILISLTILLIMIWSIRKIRRNVSKGSQGNSSSSSSSPSSSSFSSSSSSASSSSSSSASSSSSGDYVWHL